MTTTERCGYLTVMSGETDTNVLLTYIELATERVLNKMYPFGIPENATIPSKYEFTMLEIACYLINKRGAEGQVSHSENGIARTYESASVPKSMLKSVISHVGVVGNENS